MSLTGWKANVYALLWAIMGFAYGTFAATLGVSGEGIAVGVAYCMVVAAGITVYNLWKSQEWITFGGEPA